MPTRLTKLSDYRLIAFDMDSTLVTVETIDEIAALAGQGEAVARITEAAMQGQIADYSQSLLQRLALLQGTPVAVLEQVLNTRMLLTTGAAALCSACRTAGLKTLLVSGGFTYFAQRLQAQLGLDRIRANELEIVHERLTGRLVPQTWGLICDGAMKRQTLRDMAAEMGIALSQTIAVGDGANDVHMLEVAGLGVAWHGKPALRAVADVCLNGESLADLLNHFAPE